MPCVKFRPPHKNFLVSCTEIIIVILPCSLPLSLGHCLRCVGGGILGSLATFNVKGMDSVEIHNSLIPNGSMEHIQSEENTTAQIKTVIILYYKRIDKCNAQPAMYVESLLICELRYFLRRCMSSYSDDLSFQLCISLSS
jgi:hypothetical protein